MAFNPQNATFAVTKEQMEKEGKRQEYLEWLESWAFKTPQHILDALEHRARAPWFLRWLIL